VSNPSPDTTGAELIETLCNQAAAEFLVPAAEMKRHWGDARRESEPYQSLARRFKVNPLVVARRSPHATMAETFGTLKTCASGAASAKPSSAPSRKDVRFTGKRIN
jgi:Zn-dependent peptidase ImmA (M78 family)